jgi:hypothetical protein
MRRASESWRAARRCAGRRRAWRTAVLEGREALAGGLAEAGRRGGARSRFRRLRLRRFEVGGVSFCNMN